MACGIETRSAARGRRSMRRFGRERNANPRSTGTAACAVDATPVTAAGSGATGPVVRPVEWATAPPWATTAASANDVAAPRTRRRGRMVAGTFGSRRADHSRATDQTSACGSGPLSPLAPWGSGLGHAILDRGHDAVGEGTHSLPVTGVTFHGNRLAKHDGDTRANRAHQPRSAPWPALLRPPDPDRDDRHTGRQRQSGGAPMGRPEPFPVAHPTLGEDAGQAPVAHHVRQLLERLPVRRSPPHRDLVERLQQEADDGAVE